MMDTKKGKAKNPLHTSYETANDGSTLASTPRAGIFRFKKNKNVRDQTKNRFEWVANKKCPTYQSKCLWLEISRPLWLVEDLCNYAELEKCLDELMDRLIVSG